MPEYVMLMKGSAASGDWDDYIEKLVSSGKFRGGSSLGNGVSVAKGKVDGGCEVTGYMRFSAESIEEVQELITGNPLYEAGGSLSFLKKFLTRWEGRWHNSDVDAWKDVRWHELAGCGGWWEGPSGDQESTS